VAASAAAAREAAAAGNGEIMPATSLFVRKVYSLRLFFGNSMPAVFRDRGVLVLIAYGFRVANLWTLLFWI